MTFADSSRIELPFSTMPLVKKALENIYQKNNDGKKINKDLFEASYQNLAEAVTKGFGVPDKLSINLEAPDTVLLHKLQKSAIYFSARKTALQVIQLTSLLGDEVNGTTRSFTEFKKLSKGIVGNYNEDWLLTEYKTAVASARMARKWLDFEADADIYPNLKYLRTSSPNPRPEHLLFVGTVRAINDPWWNTHTPPISWNCDCGVTNTDEATTKLPDDSQEEPIDPVLQNNSGKTGELFNIPAHTYAQKTQNIPDKVIQQELKTFILPELNIYTPVYENTLSGGMLEVHAGISEAEFPVNLKEGLVLARSGHKVKLQPERFVSGIKNPDAIIDGAPADFKAPSSKTAINSAIKSVNKQLCKVAVLAIDSNMDKYTLAEGLREALGNQDKNKLVEKVIIRYTSDNTLVEFKRKEFASREFSNKLK